MQAVYDLWRRLGNTDARFPALLGNSAGLRSSATYGNRPFSLDQQVATEQLGTLRDLAEHARSIARSTRGRTINVIATRDIDAGTLVSARDIGIRPEKHPKMSSADGA